MKFKHPADVQIDRSSSLMTVWMALIALMMPPEIGLVGRLMLAEILCIVVVAWAVFSGNMPLLHPAEKMFYRLVAVWLLVQVLTDIYVGSDPSDFLRGWARIVFFAIDFTAVRIVAGRSLERATLFLLLVLLAAALKFYIGTGNIEKTGELVIDWKFGYGAAFTVFVMYAGAQMQRLLRTSLFGTAAVFAAAAASLALNARSLFGQTAFAALAGPAAATRVAGKIGVATVMLLFVLTIGVGLGAVEVYSYAASEGLLGRDAQDKYERQADNDLGLLLSGRTELLGSLDAIADSPIVGYGSSAHNMNYAELRYIRLKLAGIPVSPYIDDDRIPTHSFLFGAWVESGIIGALFWIWVLYATIRGMVHTLERYNLYNSLVIFAGTALIWDVLFSPFGLDRRIVTSALLNIMLIVTANVTTPAVTGQRQQTPHRLSG